MGTSHCEFKIAQTHAQYQDEIEYGLVRLKTFGRKLNKEKEKENRDLLIIHAQHAKQIGDGLMWLDQAGIATQENYECLINHASNAAGIGLSLHGIHKIRDLNSDLNRARLMTHAQHADKIGYALYHLYGVMRGCDAQEVFDFLIAQAPHANEISEGLYFLCDANLPQYNKNKKSFITQNTLALLAAYPQYAIKMARGIITLIKEELITTDSDLAFLTLFPSDAEQIAMALELLNRVKLNLEPNRSLLIPHIQHIYHIANAMLHLTTSNKLLTQSNFAAIFQYPEFLETTLSHIFSVRDQIGFNAIIEKNRIMHEQRKMATITDTLNQTHPGLFARNPIAKQPEPPPSDIIFAYLYR